MPTETKRRLLALLGLPAFSTVSEFSALLHLNAYRLMVLSRHSYSFYKRYSVRKRSGGWRLIHQPTAELKAVQAWILRNILDRLVTSDFATAFRVGSNIQSNVAPHSSNRYFLCMDLENFFPSVKSGRVFWLFESIGYASEISSFLTSLCCANGGLPQGGVTSPVLSNLVCERLDRRLATLASRANASYTRYADDITISSNNPVALRRIINVVMRIVKDEGFRLNYSKCCLVGPDRQCKVTGLVKNSSEPGFSVGRRNIRKIRSDIYNLSNNRATVTYKNWDQIEGYIGFVASVDEALAHKLRNYRNRLKRDGGTAA